MPIYFYNPNALLWLWLVPAAIGLFIYAAVKRKKAILAFGAGALFVSRKREAFCSCAAIALVVLALARPAWDLQEQQLQETGRDVIFLLDVSRSMLADDMHPNRLENAKTAILDCVEDLSGDRVGLVLFAGSAEIRCPLTVDYDYFRMALRQASPDSVTAGGTMIAHAIDRTVDKLIDPENAGMQDLILITDGEDMVDGPDEIEVVKLLEEAGVRLIAIGIGDRSRGSRIALEDEETGARSFMKHGNTEVWTKLHSETLRRMTAAAADGIYFDVANGPFDLARIYRQVMEHAERTSTDKQVMERYEEKFHLFLGAVVVILLISNRWRKKK
jgi:Ca-activated chloride channel family protein